MTQNPSHIFVGDYIYVCKCIDLSPTCILFTKDTTNICDRIWENVHSSHIRFCAFKVSSNMIGKAERCHICCTDRGIVALQSLQVSCLSDMYNRFYESSKLKKWMCELCTFSQIRSHISTLKRQIFCVFSVCKQLVTTFE